MRRGVFQIMQMVRLAQTIDEKVQVLRKNDSPPLRTILRYALDPRVTWVLPEGIPPYKPLPKNQQLNSEYMLLKEARTMYLFVSGGDEVNPNVIPQRREKLFVDLLEAVHPEDALVILAAKDRAIDGIDRDLVSHAFPGLLPDQGIIQRAASVVAKAFARGQGRDPAKIAAKRERDKIRGKAKRARLRAAREAKAAQERAASAVLHPSE